MSRTWVHRAIDDFVDDYVCKVVNLQKCVGQGEISLSDVFLSQTGRKLVFRSEPPRHKKREDDGADQASREEEELAYFFQY